MSQLFIHSTIDDAGLDSESFRLLCHLARRSDGSGVAFAGIRSMGRVCGFCKDTIARRLRFLEEKGFVERVKRPGKASGFRLIEQEATHPTPSDILRRRISDPVGHDLSDPVGQKDILLRKSSLKGTKPKKPAGVGLLDQSGLKVFRP